MREHTFYPGSGTPRVARVKSATAHPSSRIRAGGSAAAALSAAAPFVAGLTSQPWSPGKHVEILDSVVNDDDAGAGDLLLVHGALGMARSPILPTDSKPVEPPVQHAADHGAIARRVQPIPAMLNGVTVRRTG